VTRLHSLANRRSDFLIANQRTGRGGLRCGTLDTSIMDKSSQKILANRRAGSCARLSRRDSIPSNVPLVWPSRTRNSLPKLTPLCACHTIRSCCHHDPGHKRKSRRADTIAVATVECQLTQSRLVSSPPLRASQIAGRRAASPSKGADANNHSSITWNAYRNA
jgi:hypothetical protein